MSGSELKGSITFDGPIDTAEQIAGKRLHEASETYRYNPARKDETLVFGSLVDFEHLNPIKNQKASEKAEDEEEVASEEESVAERRARRAKERKKALEERQRQQEDMMHQRKTIREEGDPFQKTYKAKKTGWYRFCVTASWNNIDVEIDLRRSKEMGGVGENGHVYTLEEKALAEEENLMEEDTAEKEGVSEEDFKATQDKLKTLRRLLGMYTQSPLGAVALLRRSRKSSLLIPHSGYLQPPTKRTTQNSTAFRDQRTLAFTHGAIVAFSNHSFLHHHELPSVYNSPMVQRSAGVGIVV